MKSPKKLLLIGAFPKKNSNKKIFGGQITACQELITSNYFNEFCLKTLDSTSISNPPPNILVRATFALKRIINLFLNLILFKPNIVIIFVADKSSALEKGLMILISKMFHFRVMIFPRAGSLIDQFKKNKIFNLFIKRTFSKADIFLCQGKTFQEFAINNLGFDINKAPIIPNWTANSDHLQIGLRRINSKENNLNRILFMGWVENFKGIGEILESIYILKNKKYNFHLFIAGDGNAKNSVLNFIKKFNLEDYVTLRGWVDNEEKLKILKKTNIFLLPSWNEGFPNAMIEAMSAGMSCIVSNVGLIPDFLTNEQNALLINQKNEAA